MFDYGCIPGLDLDSAALLRVNVQSNQANMRSMPRFALAAFRFWDLHFADPRG